MNNTLLELSEPFAIIKNGTIYNLYSKILMIIIIIALAEIIYFIVKKQYKKCFNVIVLSIINTIVYSVGNNIARSVYYSIDTGMANDASNASNAIFIIVGLLILIIQLIPFIICLRKNKRVKKDEVKQ